MSAVVHEFVSIAAGAGHLVEGLRDFAEQPHLTKAIRRQVEPLAAVATDLQHSVERQAAYLTDLVSADAKRRRSRLQLSSGFDSAIRLVGRAADQDEISVQNAIPPDLRSPPMFRSELVSVFTNLLTNAVKAAGKGGKVVASGRATEAGSEVTIQNTGMAVKLSDSERWFEPFETTTAAARPLLGQGMGLGLTITRRMIESYRGVIEFVQPTPGFSTAVRIQWPR